VAERLPNRVVVRLVAAAFLVCLFGPMPASAGTWLSAITGTCLDELGKPMPGATLRFTDPANGKHFEVTSDSDGKFIYVAVEPSRYRLDIYRTRHQQVTFPGVYLEWSSQPLLLEVSLQQNTVKVSRQVMLAESFGNEQPAVIAPEGKDAATARAINEQLAAAKAFMDAGDWDHALAAARAATEIDPNRDLPWAWLANVYCEEASHTIEPSGSLRQKCIQNYKYAIAIAPNATYYNNLGTAYSSLKNWTESAENFRAAVHLNPDHSALYHQNLGAAMLNKAESLSANEALATLQLALAEFNSAASATPPISEAFYWIGLCQLRLAAAQVSGSTYDSAGEAFRHYLQLAPGGPYATQAQVMLDGLQEFSTGARRSDSKP
jgi:tetratricopeptide (TPR) repeat protein